MKDWQEFELDALICPAFTGKDIALKLLKCAARDSAGLPLAVQVVTLPLREEKCLAVMKQVENVWME
ncbi:unnamed protein product [Gongylonema pulchrum]|uniref:Usp domain-containing protein n=1 Tax=Gongylonema pulchrum TaxID=637853 RepID=A0A183EP48_9BILA|nr:unnamed protein product [Gongylonema pulchrum]